MSDKIKKEKKEGKAGVKSPAKSRPAAKTAPPAAAKKTATPEQPEKPLITSNSEETGISRSLFSLLLVAVLIGGGFATQPLWSPYVVDYLPGLKNSNGQKLSEDTLSDRLGEIEKEVEQVRKGGEAIADLERERGQMNQSFEGVMARILELEKQIDYVRGMLQATSPPSDAVETNESLQRLSSRMNKLETSGETVNVVMERLAKLEQAMADSGSNANNSAEQLSQIMAGISERLGSLETGVAQSSAGDAAANALAQKQVQAQTLVLAVGHLRETLRSSAPFAPALDALKALAQGDPDIMRGVKELAPYGKTGIATMDSLRREYISAADAIAAAAPPSVSSEDVLGGVLTTIKSLVSVRKEGGLDSIDANASPATKARARLDEGDLEGAVAILSELVGPQASAAAPWLERARARLMAETALSRLHVFVVSLLAPVNN
ncbi:MAG: hypothetical protein H8E36_14960 [Rhodospirillaceae bacterium]|nr:hypothetical protein [Rhodospirillaceae bacterium]